MTDDLTDRLNAACVGRHAGIPWPHRLLHEAAAEIERLRVRVAGLEVTNAALAKRHGIG